MSNIPSASVKQEIDRLQQQLMDRTVIIKSMTAQYPEEMSLIFDLIARMQEANDEAFRGLDEVKKIMYTTQERLEKMKNNV